MNRRKKTKAIWIRVHEGHEEDLKDTKFYCSSSPHGRIRQRGSRFSSRSLGIRSCVSWNPLSPSWSSDSLRVLRGTRFLLRRPPRDPAMTNHFHNCRMIPGFIFLMLLASSSLACNTFDFLVATPTAPSTPNAPQKPTPTLPPTPTTNPPPH